MNEKKKYIIIIGIIVVIAIAFMTIFLLHRKNTKVSATCEVPIIESILPNETQQNNIINELEPVESSNTEIPVNPGTVENYTGEIIENKQEISHETYPTAEKNTTKVQSSTTTKETTKKTDDKITIQNTKEENLPVTQPEETQKETAQPEEPQPELVQQEKVEPEIETEQPQETTPQQEEIKENDSVVEKEETNKIDLSKYDYYEKSLNGSYKGFIKDTEEIAKLKSLINTCIIEMGYTNAKIENNADSSLARSGLRYFTTNITNVRNAVYDCDGFTISYYAEKEYHISADGKETFFQTRSYIKVK